NNDDANYYEYGSYYVVILYEQEKYRDVITFVEAEQEKAIAHPYEDTYVKLHYLANEMRQVEEEQVLQAIKRSVNERTPIEQVRHLQQWRTIAKGANSFILSLLTEKDVHPLAKTIIVEALRERGERGTIQVEKFGESQTFQLDAVSEVLESPFYRLVMKAIGQTEQKDPTLQQMMEELLEQVTLVSHPFSPFEKEVQLVVEALKV